MNCTQIFWRLPPKRSESTLFPWTFKFQKGQELETFDYLKATENGVSGAKEDGDNDEAGSEDLEASDDDEEDFKVIQRSAKFIEYRN